MKKLGFGLLTVATAVMAAGCQFTNKSSLLMPTSPSASSSNSSVSSGSGVSTSSSSTSTASSGSSSSGIALPAGSWASPTIAGLPNLGSCTNLQWQISSESPTSIDGSISTVCGGIVTITSNLSGTMADAQTVNLSASGQAVGLGITCPFSLTGVGHMQGSNAMQLDYTGTTCAGPVSGSQLLQRRTSSPASPSSTTDSAPAPEPEAPQQVEDDGAFGCASQPDHYQVVACIHSHINPHNEFEAFEVTKRVAWALRGEGAGLLIKNSGENIVSWKGYSFAAGRICYPDGHIFKVISDVGAGGANGPSWQDNGYVASNLYVSAIDPR